MRLAVGQIEIDDREIDRRFAEQSAGGARGGGLAYDDDGIEVTLFREGRKPQGAVAYDP